MMEDLAFQQIGPVAAGIASGTISAAEAVGACLKQIESHDGRLRVFTEVFADDASEQARRYDKLRDQGRMLGPLHGVPIAIKDLFDIAGRVNTGGTAFRRTAPAAVRTAAAVSALENAGAIILGKVNLDELAFGVASSNEHFGFVINPWGENLIPGGSSGGSAAAVAAGMAFATLGTDTGGSVRIPAAFTGTAALKVTTGIISTEGCFGLSSTLDSVGPMARTVADLVVLFELLQQTSSMRSHPSRRRKSLKGLCIGIEESFYLDPMRMSDDCEKVMRATFADLEAAGVELCPISLPSIPYAEAAQKAILLAEAADYHSGELYDQRQNYGAILRGSLPLGDFVLAKDYLAALRFRFALAREYAAAFETVDFIAAPGVPFAACPHGTQRIKWRDGSDDHLFDAAWRTCFPSNLVGIPSLCQPCGLSDDGLPIGLQLIAPALRELDLLSVGVLLEDEFSWRFRPPLAGAKRPAENEVVD